MRPLITLLFLSILGLSFTQLVHIPLNTEHSITRHMEGFNQKLHFNFTVEKFVPGQDLLFIVNPLDWISNPDILISSKYPFPSNVREAEHMCWIFGADVCPVPSSALAVNKVFYISVFCPFTCSFTIEAKYNTETILKLNKKETLYFTGEQAKSTQGQVVKFTIPNDFKDDHILIQAIPKETDTLDFNLGMFINKGETPPSSTFHSMKGLPSWHNGVSYSLKTSTGYFCLGCTYTMLITTGDDVIVDVLARSLSNEITIKLQERIYDFMFERQDMHYVLQIDTTSLVDYHDRDVNIELRPYTGNPNIYVNLNTKPENLKGYAWISEEFGIEAIRIAPEDRYPYQSKDSSIEKFYITVSSNEPATFSILAYLDNKNNKPLEFGITETGYVQKKELETYILKVPAQKEEERYTLTIGLHVLSGNPDLYVKSCPDNYVEGSNNKDFRTLCSISEEEIEQYLERQGGKGFFVASNSLSGNEQVSFVNGPPACALTSGDCHYVIGVYGNSENGIKSHYSVLASHNLKHTILQLTIPVKHTIQINEYRYYKFTLPDDRNIMSLHFQLTPISGDAGMFSSKTDQFPTKEKFGKVACFCSHIITYCGFSNNDIPLKGTYYIAVYGFTHAAYTITALTRSSVGPNVIQLMEAVPHRFVFPTTGKAQQEVNFRFNTEFDPIKSSGVSIMLSPLKGGDFKILVSEGFLPNQNNAVWTSVTNSLDISAKDENFIPNGQYFVSVVPYDPASPEKKDFDTKNWQFALQFHSGYNLVELVDGHSTIGRASKGMPAYFRFAVNKDDEELQVTVTQYGKPVMLYLSTHQGNAFPTDQKNDFSGQQSIRLNRNDIKSFCYQDEQKGQISGSYCPVYVGVFADKSIEGEQEFTITVQKTESLIYLQEGIPDLHPVPIKGKYIDYAISPRNNSDIILNLNTKSPLKAYFTVVNTKEHPHKYEWKVQETEQNLIKDQNEHYGEIHLTLNSALWAKNEESMVIIRLKNTEGTSKDPGATFTLSYGESVRYIMDSSLVFGRVTKDTHQYYKFSTGKEKIKSLRVILTPLTSGLPELYLSRIDNGVPTRESYEYRSQDPSNPSITIDNAQGTFYIAVYSPNNCSYSLMYTTLPETFVNVRGGVPVSVTTSSEHEKGMYLVYTPPPNSKGFKVLYSKEAGNPELYLLGFGDSSAKNQLLEIKEKDRIGGFAEKGEEDVKKNLEYVLFVKNDGSKSENKVTVLFSENDQYSHLPSGKSFKDSVAQYTPNLYYYVSPDLADDEHVEISLVVYQGNAQIIASTDPNVEKNPMWSASKEPGKSSIEMKILRQNVLPNKVPNLKGPKVLTKGQTLYIVVRGEGLYDIRITVGKRAMSLEDGIITTGVLTRQENKTFTFHSKFDPSEKKVITLVYTILNGDNKQVNVFPDIEIGYVPDTNAATKDDRRVNDRFIERNYEERKGFSSRVYRFIARKALYVITLSLPSGGSSAYSMSLNINGVMILPPNNEMIGYLTEGNTDIYQVNVPSKGNLLLQFFECFGNLKVYMQSKDDKPEQNYKEIQPTQENGYSLIPVEQGIVYIKVVATKGWTMFTPKTAEGSQAKVSEAAYKISSVFMPLGQKAPQQLFQPGNNGLIQASPIGDGKYNITWNNVELLDKGASQSNIDIYETIYVSRSEKALEMAAKCQLVPDTEFVFTLEHGEDMKVWAFPTTSKINQKVLNKEIELDTASTGGNSALLVRIAAKVQPTIKAGYDVPVSVFYQQSEINENSPGIFEKFKTVFGGFAVGLGVIIIVACIVRCCNKRKEDSGEKHREVQYEMGKVEEGNSYSGQVIKYEGFHDEETVEQEQNSPTLELSYKENC